MKSCGWQGGCADGAAPAQHPHHAMAWCPCKGCRSMGQRWGGPPWGWQCGSGWGKTRGADSTQCLQTALGAYFHLQPVVLHGQLPHALFSVTTVNLEGKSLATGQLLGSRGPNPFVKGESALCYRAEPPHEGCWWLLLPLVGVSRQVGRHALHTHSLQRGAQERKIRSPVLDKPRIQHRGMI